MSRLETRVGVCYIVILDLDSGLNGIPNEIDGTIFQQALSGGRASLRNSSEVVCGMRARIAQELEQNRQHEGPSTFEPASASASQPSERQVRT